MAFGATRRWSLRNASTFDGSSTSLRVRAIAGCAIGCAAVAFVVRASDEEGVMAEQTEVFFVMSVLVPTGTDEAIVRENLRKLPIGNPLRILRGIWGPSGRPAQDCCCVKEVQ